MTKTPDPKKMGTERLRRAEEKRKDNLADFAASHTKKDGSKMTAADLEGHHKLYDVALRKIIIAEGGTVEDIPEATPEVVQEETPVDHPEG